MKKVLLILLLFIICFYSQLSAQEIGSLTELYEILIQNKQNGSIYVSENKGQSWEAVGHVLYPCVKVNYEGYTASKWASVGEVAATAVNAIHIKVGDKKGRGVVFSIVPKEMQDLPPYYNSFNSPDSSIYTDISAGKTIFGGGYSPFVGNPVGYINSGNEFIKLKEGYIPKIGDSIIIKVLRPSNYPKAIIFENKFGGAIRITYGGDFEEVIGEVLKPVQGIGRFTGTQYAGAGRIRANHTGVIDISTAPLGLTGGFQIIPSFHGMSKEMINARILTQWLVIGPITIFGKPLEGMPPFFWGYLQPRYRTLDINSFEIIRDLLNRFIVDVKLEGKDEWTPMPRLWLDPDLRKHLPIWANSALKNVEEIRILFPVE